MTRGVWSAAAAAGGARHCPAVAHAAWRPGPAQSGLTCAGETWVANKAQLCHIN